jgi:hypothetical protein
MPAGECPHSFFAIQALGFVFSHSEVRSSTHMAQAPHAIGNGTTTRSPMERFLTAGPMSTISPMNSWPEDVALLHRRDEPVVEVQVGAADRGRG